MAKRTKTPHQIALAHFICGRITREEYILCIQNRAVTNKTRIYLMFGWQSHWRPLYRPDSDRAGSG